MLCDDQEGWDEEGRELTREGIYGYIHLIHVVVRQEPTQHCKQLSSNLKKNELTLLISASRGKKHGWPGGALKASPAEHLRETPGLAGVCNSNKLLPWCCRS